ncbi:MAG TPA: TonB-dependent receptor [Azospirillaceae bacterium]|nr:TonB-dependent receptor [Azospirillaceae bacterium]
MTVDPKPAAPKSTPLVRRLLAGAALMLAGAWAPQAAAVVERDVSVADLGRLSLEELGDLEVTSVAKRKQSLSDAPAAVHVLSGEDILSAGPGRLPEALRLAPNLHVGRYDTLGYAITARGFNGYETANKLLVLIDGRSVYSPMHSGVFWDTQDVMLEDLERIEVVSGPGGTLWGANAVNGVVNVLTKNARDTVGNVASLQLGTEERRASVRHGGELGGNGAYRIYAMGFERDRPGFTVGFEPSDEWHGLQGGARVDWESGRDRVTLQGDAYDSRSEVNSSPTSTIDFELWGANALGRWTRSLDNGSVELQAYYDHVDRYNITGDEKVDTYDVQAQHAFSPWEGHELVWGAGHRIIQDDYFNILGGFQLAQRDRTLHLSNVFIQDEVALADTLRLTLGLKLERSSFTGIEWMPNARLAWKAAPETLLWAAVSRAVRTPSRIERELTFPGVLLPGGFDSEKLVAFEAGYRGQPRADVTLSVSTYFNLYDGLRTTSPLTAAPIPLGFRNGLKGHTYGLEASAEWLVRRGWRLGAGTNLIGKSFEPTNGFVDRAARGSLGNDPNWQFFLRSRADLTESVSLDVQARAVDELPREVASYIAVDARLAWRLSDAAELALNGRNLTDKRHSETGAPPSRREYGRSVSLDARWSF